MALAQRSPFLSGGLLVVTLVIIGHLLAVLGVAKLPIKTLPQPVATPKVKVKFVTIAQPKVEPVKAQPKKKQQQPKAVKIVEKPITQPKPKPQPVEKEKIITQKHTEIKKKDKVIRQDDRLEKEKQAQLEKERLERERLAQEKLAKEQAERERLERERLAKEQAEREKAEREKAEREKAEREKAEREKAEREQAEKEKQRERNLGDAAQVAWKKKPNPRLTTQQLKTVTNNQLQIRIQVDTAGRINPSIIQSSGNTAVDKEFLRAVRNAQFYPYTEDGVAVPFYAIQVFQLQ